MSVAAVAADSVGNYHVVQSLNGYFLEICNY